MRTDGKIDFPVKQLARKRIVILADMNVSSLTEGHSGRGGGQAASWLPQIATGFEQIGGLEFIWVMLDPKAGRAQIQQVGAQWFIKLPTLKMSRSVLTRHFFARRKLRQVIRDLAPDLVHAWGLERSYPSALKGLQVPTILSVQGILSRYWTRKVLPDTWQWKWQARFEPRWVRSADVVTCESKWGGNVLRSSYPGVDVRKVEYGVHESFYKVNWEPIEDQPYLIFVGTVSTGKGVDILADALKSLPERKWRCLIAGSGPFAAELEKQAIPGVELLGMVPWDVLQKKMRHAWVMVLPTLADTSPNVIKEARVLGMPVVVSAHGGQTDYVVDQENGLIVDPLDAEHLAEACGKLMSDFAAVKRMGATRHELDRVYFRPEKTCKEFVRIYHELLCI